jgi:hypothetical protein
MRASHASGFAMSGHSQPVTKNNTMKPIAPFFTPHSYARAPIHVSTATSCSAITAAIKSVPLFVRAPTTSASEPVDASIDNTRSSPKKNGASTGVSGAIGSNESSRWCDAGTNGAGVDVRGRSFAGRAFAKTTPHFGHHSSCGWHCHAHFMHVRG